jgi:hypothetical protein
VEDRARSYLDVNCAQCHREGRVVQVTFDARYEVPLADQGMIWGPVRWPSLPDGDEFIVAPRDQSRSKLLRRLARGDMPPLGHVQVDAAAVALLAQWIAGMPGKPGMAAVVIRTAPAASRRVKVALEHPDREVEIHYTTDNTPADRSTPRYQGPFEVSRPAVVRAVAYRDGFVQSRPSAVELLVDE